MDANLKTAVTTATFLALMKQTGCELIPTQRGFTIHCLYVLTSPRLRHVINAEFYEGRMMSYMYNNVYYTLEELIALVEQGDLNYATRTP